MILGEEECVLFGEVSGVLIEGFHCMIMDTRAYSHDTHTHYTELMHMQSVCDWVWLLSMESLRMEIQRRRRRTMTEGTHLLLILTVR